MAAPTIDWPGISGKNYRYWIHSIGTEFLNQGGNYIFAKETSPGSWVPIYIGQTSSLRNRLENHEKEACARRNGATHIHAHTTPIESSRPAEEKDLVDRWKPVCNR